MEVECIWQVVILAFHIYSAACELKPHLGEVKNWVVNQEVSLYKLFHPLRKAKFCKEKTTVLFLKQTCKQCGSNYLPDFHLLIPPPLLVNKRKIPGRDLFRLEKENFL